MLKRHLKQHKLGQTLQIKVQPRSRKKGFLGVQGEIVRWGVLSPAEDGKANDELITDLSKALKVPKATLSIIKGATHRLKVVLVQSE